MKQLFSLFESVYHLPDAFYERVASILQYQELKKRQLLLKPGEICRNIYFVEHGLLRSYYVLNGKEVNNWFMEEHNLIVSIVSFYRQVRSNEFIQALEPTALHYISKAELETLCRDFPEFYIVRCILTEHYYTLGELRNYSLKMHTAKERYDYLQEQQPSLFQRLPLRLIASYLNIHPQYLSVIRKNR